MGQKPIQNRPKRLQNGRDTKGLCKIHVLGGLEDKNFRFEAQFKRKRPISKKGLFLQNQASNRKKLSSKPPKTWILHIPLVFRPFWGHFGPFWTGFWPLYKNISHFLWKSYVVDRNISPTTNFKADFKDLLRHKNELFWLYIMVHT